MNELIIDAHVHLPIYDNLLTLEDKRRQLLQDMKKDHVDKCVLISDSELESCIGSMEDCICLFADDDNVLVVCGISPLIDFDKQLERLRHHIESGEAAGIKLFPGHEGFYLSDSRLLPVWHIAEEYAVPVLFHSGWDNSFYASPSEVRKVLNEHPKLKMVCCHCFYPDIKECLQLTDLSGLMFDLSSIADEEETVVKLIPHIKELIELIPDRIMFGSDYASCKREPHLQMIESLGLSQEIKTKVMAENALSLYSREA